MKIFSNINKSSFLKYNIFNKQSNRINFNNNNNNNFYKHNKFFLNTDFDPSKDYYKTLGLSNNSTDKDIKKAYHQLVRKHHPDLNGGKTTEAFKEATNAYDILSDNDKRKRYDSARGGGFFNGFGSRNNNNANTNTNNSNNNSGFNNYGGSYRAHNPFNSSNRNKNNSNNFYSDFSNFYKEEKKDKDGTYNTYTYKDSKTGEHKKYTFYRSNNSNSNNNNNNRYEYEHRSNPFMKDFDDIMNGINKEKQRQYDEYRRNTKNKSTYHNYNSKYYQKEDKDSYKDYVNNNHNENNNNQYYNDFNNNQYDYNYHYNNQIFLYRNLRIVLFTTIFIIFLHRYGKRVEANNEYRRQQEYLRNVNTQNPQYTGGYIYDSNPKYNSNDKNMYHNQYDVTRDPRYLAGKTVYVKEKEDVYPLYK